MPSFGPWSRNTRSVRESERRARWGLSVSTAADSRKADQDLHRSGIADHSGGIVEQRHGPKPKLFCNSLTYKNLSLVFHSPVSEAGLPLGKALPGRDGCSPSPAGGPPGSVALSGSTRWTRQLIECQQLRKLHTFGRRANFGEPQLGSVEPGRISPREV